MSGTRPQELTEGINGGYEKGVSVLCANKLIKKKKEKKTANVSHSLKTDFSKRDGRGKR